MAGLTEKQKNILFDLIYKGSPSLEKGQMFGMKNFPSGTDTAHSIIDGLIQKNNLMNVLKDPDTLANIFGRGQNEGFPYSGDPRDASFNPQTHSFESYDEGNPMNLSKLDILRASYGSEADKEIGALQKLLQGITRSRR
jgi:hypothetical protein